MAPWITSLSGASSGWAVQRSPLPRIQVASSSSRGTTAKIRSARTNLPYPSATMRGNPLVIAGKRYLSGRPLRTPAEGLARWGEALKRVDELHRAVRQQHDPGGGGDDRDHNEGS